MKWYYKWKLNRIHAEIESLKESTQSRLRENYTDQSRLRILNRIAGNLETRLGKYPNPPAPDQSTPLS